MDERDQALRKRLLEIFQEEAREHVGALSSYILRLEKNTSGETGGSALEAAFRAAHSLKGAARVVNHLEIEELCGALESVFSDLKKQVFIPSSETFDVLFAAMGELEGLLGDVAAKNEANPDRFHAVIHALAGIRERSNAEPTGQRSLGKDHFLPRASSVGGSTLSTASHEKPAPASRGGMAETVRISTAKLEAIRRQAEDLFSQKLSAVEQTAALKSLGAALSHWRKQPKRDLAFLDTVEGQIRRIYRDVRRHRNALSSKLDRLLEDSREVTMMPCEALAEGLTRLVRDLAQELGKEAHFTITGGEIQMDRYVINELRDPVFHMIRNALDHGLEAPAERDAAGKSRCGHVQLAVRHIPGDRVELCIEDDGRGIDISRLREMVESKEPSTTPLPVDEDALVDQVFHSSVTTRSIVSGISGRGLGLAIVREKAEKLGGSARIENRAGRGLRLLLTLPLSVATVRGIIVRVGGARFVVPTADVQQAVSLPAKEGFRNGSGRAVKMGDESLNLVRLGDMLGIGSRHEERVPPARFPGLIIHQNGRRLFLQVDAVEREYELLVEPIGAPFLKLSMVTGATVLGTGVVAPILNVGALMDGAMSQNPKGEPSPPKSRTSEGERASILLVEDSETSRAWLRSILESAGYRVEIAVDGVDAWHKLQRESFQLVVSDIDMPRLNGIKLTERIRGLTHLHSMPVVLITSLDAPEHRKGGMKAGASAFFVKGNSGQSDLLATIRRLL